MTTLSRSSTTQATTWLLAFVAPIALLILIITSSKAPFHDEPFYLNNVGYLEHFGFTWEFMTNVPGPAGPLHSIVHWLLKPLTSLAVPQTRVVSWLFVVGAAVALTLAVQKLRGKTAPTLSGFEILLFPPIMGTACFAMTEAPAIGFLCLGLLCVGFLHQSPPLTWQSHASALFSGLFLGLAVLGRQPLLPALIFVPILFLMTRKWTELFTFGVALLPAPLLMYAAWHGFRPTWNVEQTHFVPAFNSHCLILAFAYIAMALLLIHPGLIRASKRPLIFGLLFGLLADVIWIRIKFLPMQPQLSKILPSLGSDWAPLTAGTFLAALACGGLFVMAHQIWQNRSNPVVVAFGLATIVGASTLSVIGITGRYVAPLIPLLLLAFRSSKPNQSPPLWIALGATLIGVGSAFLTLHTGQGNGFVTPHQLIFYPDLFRALPNYHPERIKTLPQPGRDIFDFNRSNWADNPMAFPPGT